MSDEALEVLNVALSALLGARTYAGSRSSPKWLAQVDAAVERIETFFGIVPDDSFTGRVKATRRSFDILVASGVQLDLTALVAALKSVEEEIVELQVLPPINPSDLAAIAEAVSSSTGGREPRG